MQFVIIICFILLYYEYYIYYLIIILNIDLKKSYLDCRILYQVSDSEILKKIHSPETKKKKLYIVIINNNLLYIYIYNS